MIESQSVPMYRVGYPIITDALDALYAKVKSKGVTMTDLPAKAAAMALVQHPVVNISCKNEKSFTYNGNINIAVAVAINGGLITPVLQDADKLDLYLLSEKWKELVEQARSKQLQPYEYNSGTFTLSNLGMFGVDRFDAVLPPGQGAIMAVGVSKPTAVADKDGYFSVKSQMVICCMVIRVNLDCNSCCRKMRRNILNMKEIEKHLIEKQQNRVSICGRFKPADVAIKLRKKMNRRVEILEIEEMTTHHESQQEDPTINHYKY